jgi:phosphocarrier protein
MFVLAFPRLIEPCMSDDTPVVRHQVEISNSLGLHLRCADQFVRTARRFQAEIRVWHRGNGCNGKSIIDLIALAVECGSRVELEARGPDADAAIEALARVVLARFYEDGDAPNSVERGLSQDESR